MHRWGAGAAQPSRSHTPAPRAGRAKRHNRTSVCSYCYDLFVAVMPDECRRTRRHLHMRTRPYGAFALFSFGIASALGQDALVEPDKQQAISEMRDLARTIKGCPKALELEMRWGKGPLEIVRVYYETPNNVVWDVTRSQTARSPYAGYIEFSISHLPWVPPETIDKFRRTRPDMYKDFFLQPLSTRWSLRYEFDIGPEGVEFVKANSAQRDVCWDNTARKGHRVPNAPKQ